MRDISLVHILIVVAIIVILFGAKRLPDVTRSVTKSMRIFKTEVKELRDEDKPARTGDDDSTTSATSSKAPAPLEGRSVDEARESERARVDEQNRPSA